MRNHHGIYNIMILQLYELSSLAVAVVFPIVSYNYNHYYYYLLLHIYP